ncbi:hypothetical protein [Coleofasciculus sp. F4-SAH-05]|uniref:hypothetical protein n=1 Tax=Coleofasciculus sp. F4-SAH-05 TaxID=3069525 RepID=UPI0032F29CB2
MNQKPCQVFILEPEERESNRALTWVNKTCISQPIKNGLDNPLFPSEHQVKFDVDLEARSPFSCTVVENLSQKDLFPEN